MVCKKCGVKIPDGRDACCVCGEKITLEVPTSSPVFQSAGNLMGRVVGDFTHVGDFGGKSVEQPRFCQICGRKISGGAKFCPDCGNNVLHLPNTPAGLDNRNIPPKPPKPAVKRKKKRSVFKPIIAIAAVLVLVVGIVCWAFWRSLEANVTLADLGTVILAEGVGSYDEDAYDCYIAAGEATVASGNWQENLTMTANMVLSNDEMTQKTKATLHSVMDISGYSENGISGLRMSGSVDMKIAGQEYAWTVDYANGMAHYEYTKPTVKSADMKIDPNYFEFNSLTKDMIIASSVSGNTIRLTVSGEKMTAVGLSAVDMMGGVENLKYGDVSVEAVIDSVTGKIDTVTMKCPATMTYQGYDAQVDYEIIYQYKS